VFILKSGPKNVQKKENKSAYKATVAAFLLPTGEKKRREKKREKKREELI